LSRIGGEQRRTQRPGEERTRLHPIIAQMRSTEKMRAREIKKLEGNRAMAAEQKQVSSFGPDRTSTSVRTRRKAPLPGGEPVRDRLAGLDMRAQSALLQEAFERPNAPELEVSDPVARALPKARSCIARWGWRALKSVLGLAVIIVAGVGPMQRLLEFSSVEAVVNARLVSLRAPIDGRIEETDFVPVIGAAAPKGGLMLRITNSRADRGRLDDLQRQVDETESERPAITQRISRLKELHQQILQQARAFQSGRIKELEERSLDLKAQIAAAQATEVQGTSTLERTRSLLASGVQTKVALEQAERDAKVASENERALNHRLIANEIELDAARRGEYVGDTYNDRPSSLQQADELSIRIAEAEAELSARDRRLAKLHAERDAEAARYSDFSSAVLSSPIEARVWEVLVSPGEEVRKGQDLLRLLDCSGALVTTTVRESVFNELRLGDKAQFRFSGQSRRYDGVIVRMSGTAAPPDNLAIQPTGLASGGYRVAVSIPDLASSQCAVGRTGTVVFNQDGSGGILRSVRDAISLFLPGS
jgi:multidrug resistance efflux pump